MMTRTSTFLLALLVLGACSATVTVPSASSIPSTPVPSSPSIVPSTPVPDDDDDDADEVKGKVTSKTDTSIVLLDEKGVTRTIVIPAGTTIEIDGKVLLLSDLKIGDGVEIKLMRNATGTITIVKITREDADKDDDKNDDDKN